MTSITDCVVEGLKYPFNDLKKVLGFGVLFTLISLITLDISIKFIVDMIITYSKLDYPSCMRAALFIISFIIVLFINGYEWNIVKFSIDKREDIPGFSNISNMFDNGVKYFLVSVAYNVIPIIVFMIGLEFINSYGQIIILISLLLFIIANFLLIMALSNMIAHDSIKKAFDLREITNNISNLGWGKYIGIIIFTLIIIMIAVELVFFFITELITVLIATSINDQSMAISIIFAIIKGLFIFPYVGLFLNRVCGSVYRESIK